MCKHILFNNYNSETDDAILHDFAEKTYDKDGFGAIIRDKTGKIFTLKSLSLSEFYFKLASTLSKLDVDTLVVHHRTSTNKDGLEYAHPFEFRGSYLTHNGVIDVPGVHETRTENDSEALLHHLIKTDFDTESIQGYFSCFIVTKDETTILVDNRAPIYTDGRVYSSHNLGNWNRVELQKITISKSGTLSVPIKVTESTYGQDKASLSLGWSSDWDDRNEIGTNDTTDFDTFFQWVTLSEENDFVNARSKRDMVAKIKNVVDSMQLTLCEQEIDEIAEYYIYYAS